MMNKLLWDLLDQGVVVYLDDILIFTRTKEEHIQLVEEVLRQLEANNLFCKPKKCFFLKWEVEYLGFQIGHRQIKMNEGKVKAVMEWPEPSTVKALQAFLVIIKCDMSDFATGAILSQRGEDGQVRPVAFHSAAMKPAERNYQVYNKELLAMIRALKEWQHYLEGAKHQVIIFSNHQNLTYFNQLQTLTRQQARWAHFLTCFDIDIRHDLDVSLENQTDYPDGRIINP